MRITICGSSSFRREMVEFRNRLKSMGHEAVVHPVYEKFARGEMTELWERIKKEHAAVKREYDFIRWYYNSIVSSDEGIRTRLRRWEQRLFTVIWVRLNKTDIKRTITSATVDFSPA